MYTGLHFFFLKYFIQKKQKAHLQNFKPSVSMFLWWWTVSPAHWDQRRGSHQNPSWAQFTWAARRRTRGRWQQAGRREENPIEEIFHFEGQFSWSNHVSFQVEKNYFLWICFLVEFRSQCLIWTNSEEWNNQNHNRLFFLLVISSFMSWASPSCKYLCSLFQRWHSSGACWRS